MYICIIMLYYSILYVTAYICIYIYMHIYIYIYVLHSYVNVYIYIRSLVAVQRPPGLVARARDRGDDELQEA